VYSDTCWQRWRRAGKPPEGPPPGRKPREPEPDPDEPDFDLDPVEIAARWGWVDPEARTKRAAPNAAELSRLVHRGDQQGVEILMSKCTDWGAMAICLAKWVDPAEAAQAVAAMAARGRNVA
jgi:hypothetical protein